MNCPQCKDEFENGQLLLEHCKDAHPEMYQIIVTKMPSLIEANRILANTPAVEIKPLPGTTVMKYIDEPLSFALIYILLAATAVVAFIFVLLNT